MIFIAIIFIWMLLAFDLEFTLTTKNKRYKLKYNGLLWVGLDYYTIIKYNSNDKVMPWVELKIRNKHLRIIR